MARTRRNDKLRSPDDVESMISLAMDGNWLGIRDYAGEMTKAEIDTATTDAITMVEQHGKDLTINKAFALGMVYQALLSSPSAR
jgi:hypothetical protein